MAERSKERCKQLCNNGVQCIREATRMFQSPHYDGLWRCTAHANKYIKSTRVSRSRALGRTKKEKKS